MDENGRVMSGRCPAFKGVFGLATAWKGARGRIITLCC